LFDFSDQLVGIDRSREDAARLALELGAALGRRFRRFRDEQNVDGPSADGDLHPLHRLERAWRVRVADDDRRPLDRDAPSEQAERHVHDPIVSRAEGDAHALGLGGGVAHEDQNALRANRAVGSRLGVGARHLGNLQRTPLRRDSPPEQAPFRRSAGARDPSEALRVVVVAGETPYDPLAYPRPETRRDDREDDPRHDADLSVGQPEHGGDSAANPRARPALWRQWKARARQLGAKFEPFFPSLERKGP
jgi:hypothetical protein